MTLTRRGDAWRVSVYAGTDPITGREHRLTQTVHGTKRRAREIEGDLRKKAAQGRLGAGDVTFGQLLTRWLEVARHEASTRYQAERRLERHVRPILGDVPLAKVGTAELDALYLRLERGDKKQRPLAASSVLRIHRDLHAAFEQALAWDWIDRNPARRARKPADAGGDPNPPTVVQVTKFLATAQAEDADLFTFVRVAAVTAMRRGEVCALRREHLDLEHGSLRRVAAIGETKGGAYEKGTKTGARDQLALDAHTVKILTAHLDRQDAIALTFGATLAGPAYLFSLDPAGATPWRPHYVTKRFAKLRDVHPELKGVQLRELRHFVATQLLDGGHSPRTVAGRLAHSRTSTTTDRYAGWLAPDDQAAALTIAGVLDDQE